MLSASMSPAACRPAGHAEPEQRAACHQGGPLLVVAGAGSGKTMTLAARVAHLVLQGADPQRILLLTFSRRAALEMQRRTGHLLHRALGLQGTQAAPALPWAGTFHSVGARLLRESAEALGLSPQFSILDRGDAEDLMALVRQEQGLSATERRFPMKGTCLSIYSRCVNSQAPLARAGPGLPLVRRVGGRAQAPVQGLCRGQAGPAGARLRRPAAVLAPDAAGARWPRRSRPASTMCWSTSTRTPTACRPASCTPSSPRVRA
jgi:hypothetical protein